MACFIVSDRPAAIGILGSALNKLRTRMGREKKRAYWRDKFMKRWITSISRGDGDTLQWLIYLESDAYEKEQERSGSVSTRDLILRYIKSIVRMTTAMTSFHVSVGVGRVLHHYETSETQRMYELVSQRYLGADQFRRAKRLLLDKLQARFGKYLKTVKDRHGEIKFETLPDQGRWADLARVCLTAFTPWSTTRTCLAQADLLASRESFANWVTAAPQSKVHYDAIEVNRCHVFIDPACFGRLAGALGFDVPDRKLALPRFFENGAADGEGQLKGHPANQPLTREERKMIEDALQRESFRRRHASARSLRIVVDGTECTQLDLGEECERRLEIIEGTRLIEIWGRDDDGDLLLSTHLISYSDQQDFVPFRITMALKNAGRLALTLSPRPQGPDEPRRALLCLNFSPTLSWFASESAQGLFSKKPVRAAGYALASAALVAVGWLVAGMNFRRELASQRIALQQTHEESRAEKAAYPGEQNPGAEGPSQTIAFYKLIPDDRSTRGAASLDMPTVFLSKGQILINLELPLRDNANRSYRTALQSFPEGDEIMTEIVPSQTGSEATVTLVFPTSLVRDGRDYTVVLNRLNSAGKAQEANTFTFHVVRRD